MCTVGLSRSLNLIFKNRDKNIPTDEELVATSDFVAVRTKGASYYSLGFNEHGCGFVSCAVNSPEWTRLVEQGQAEEARLLLAKDTEGLGTPMGLVSEMLPRVRNITEWVDALEACQDAFCGYKIVLVDPSCAKIVEVFRQQRAVRTFPDNSVSTNHFQEIDFGPKSYEQYPNSFDRLSYATKALAEARELQDIFTMLKPQDEERAAKIWRTGEFFTVSTSVIDLSAKTLYFARRLDEDYQRTPLPSSSPG